MDFTKNVLAINFKTYASSIGEKAVSLAATCNEVSTETQKPILICVSPVDVYRISQTVTIPVFSQHADAVDFGAHTGKILVSDIKHNGGNGVLINHSEDRKKMDEIKELISLCKKNKLISMVCASSPKMAKEIAVFNPDFIAYEPPELIGGDISVTTKPKVISQIVQSIASINPKIRVLVGAGVKNDEDVKTALSLGANGVLLASGVTTAKNPKQVLKKLVSALQ